MAVGASLASIGCLSPTTGPSQDDLVVNQRSVVVTETTVEFEATSGGGNPSTRVIAVASGNSNKVTGLAASAGSVTWLEATLDDTQTPTILRLRPTTGSLPPGVHTTTVTVSSNLVGVQAATVAVNLTIL